MSASTTEPVLECTVDWVAAHIRAYVDSGGTRGHRYDHVLIDCPPSLGLLTVNALAAADRVLIPMQCDFLATRGLVLLVQTIQKIRRQLNRNLQVAGILPTMFDGRLAHANEVLD